MLLSLNKIYFSYGQVQVLHGIDLDISLKKITCILGRNGVGKSTLLQNIMGLQKISSGSIKLAGQEIKTWSASLRAKKGINLVPQGRDIFPALSVDENLRIGLEARSDGLKTVPEEVFELFPVLKDMKKRRGGDLSGGQQQQLAIARALTGNPGILLLDEPTEGIQPSIIKLIGEVLRKLVAERDIAIVLVEQYLDFVKDIGDEFVIMNRGRIDHRGKTSELENSFVREHLSV